MDELPDDEILQTHHSSMGLPKLAMVIDSLTQGIHNEYLTEDNYTQGLLGDLDNDVDLSQNERDARKSWMNPLLYWTLSGYLLLPRTSRPGFLRRWWTWIAATILLIHLLTRAFVYLGDHDRARGLLSFLFLIFNDAFAMLVGLAVLAWFIKRPLYDRIQTNAVIPRTNWLLFSTFVLLWILGSVFDVLIPEVALALLEFPFVLFANGLFLLVFFVFASQLLAMRSLINETVDDAQAQKVTQNQDDTVASTMDQLREYFTKPLSAMYAIELVFPRPWFHVIPVAIVQGIAFLFNLGALAATAGEPLDTRDAMSVVTDFLYNLTILLLIIVPWRLLHNSCKRLGDALSNMV